MFWVAGMVPAGFSGETAGQWVGASPMDEPVPTDAEVCY